MDKKIRKYRRRRMIEKDINEIVVSNKFPLGKQDFKYFIDYKDNKKIRPLCIFTLEMRIHKRYFEKTKCMYFMIKDENNFNEYMKIWEKVSNIMKNKFNSEFICHKKYLKAEKNSTQMKAFIIFICQ